MRLSLNNGDASSGKRAATAAQRLPWSGCFNLLVAASVLLLAFPTALSGQQQKNYAIIGPGESLESIVAKAAAVIPSQQQLAWQKLEFIAFIHFGMNTFMDQEWGKGTEDPAVFNPTDLDARQWASVLKAAGMKLVIITAKHHDGFCLWPSKHTEHSVKNSPWKNGGGDVVREVSDACREAGLKFGVYLSPWDRHERTYGDSPAYNDYFRNQLRELLTEYGEISEVWFDGACGGGPNGKRQVYDWPSYYRVIRGLQPKAVIAIMGPDVRWVGTESGYGRETEWSVLPTVLQNHDSILAVSQRFPIDAVFTPRDLMDENLGSREKLKSGNALIWHPAETDVSIRPGWFYHESQDDLVKTPEKLVDIYYSSVGRNSVLLLNIPPDKRGRIHENDIKSLLGMCTILGQTFRKNLAGGAVVRASSEQPGHAAASIVDGDAQTYWTTGDGVDSAAIELTLQKEQVFDRALLMENIAVGQRVEAFRLEAQNGNRWREFARGTTIGYKRLLRFPAVTASGVRLVIERARTNPTLSSLALYKAPARVVVSPPEGSFEKDLTVRLSSDDGGAAIYYTLDGSTPTLNSLRYTKPILLSQSSVVIAAAASGTGLSAELSRAQFIQCLKVRAATFQKPASPEYPASGESAIIDGKRGSLDFHDKRWLGFQGDDVDVTLDLGSMREIHGISVGFLQQQGSWIFLPRAVEFFTSLDGKEWKSVNHVENPVSKSERVFVKDFSCQINRTSARFIRIVATNIGTCPSWHPGTGDKAWLFVDEATVQ